MSRAADDRQMAALIYLQNASHRMAASSPAIAAFLAARLDRAMIEGGWESEKASSARRRGMCAHCGNIFVPGWTCEVKQRLARGKGKTGDQNGSSDRPLLDRSMVYSCERCRLEITEGLEGGSKVNFLKRKRRGASMTATTVTTTATNASSRSASTSQRASPGSIYDHDHDHHRSGSRPPAAMNSTMPLVEPSSSQPVAANASSKKRQKARKGGLQAMLAKSKAESASATPGGGFGLDLMDLMKTD